MGKKVRPRNVATVWYKHKSGQVLRETIDPAKVYDTDDAVVKAHPDSFVSDEDLVVEQATAAPGEKRTTRKRTAKKK